MQVGVIFPTIRPHNEAEAVLQKWIDGGYRTFVVSDPGALKFPCAEQQIFRPWEGYGMTMNKVSQHLFLTINDLEWLVIGGDDLYPDPSYPPDVIGEECTDHFNGTFGMMQPIGDRFSANDGTAAVSPWVGREFCRRMYSGEGPFFSGYFHYWTDTELMEVSKKLGVAWVRNDIYQYHDHWTRKESRKRPAHLDRATQKIQADMGLFESRKKEGFPGYEPLPPD